MRTTRLPLPVVALALTAALLVAACGDDDDAGPSGTTSGAGTTATTGAGAGLDDATRAELEQALDDVFATVEAPGAIVGVYVGDGEPWTAVRGVADTTTQAPVAIDSLTRVGSITKTVTGTIIMQLVEEGRVDLDDTIDAWFPELPDGADITVRMLGDMSSGIDSYTADPAVVNQYLSDPTRAWTPEELVAAGTSMPRLFPPGQGFFYSNTNFVMLGLIAEELTGTPLPLLIQERIFDPLGMDSSSYPDTNEIPDPHWQGYTEQGSADGTPLDATGWSPTFAGAAGQIISDLDDMGVWARALGAGSLLDPATQEERLQVNEASVQGTRAYAFGVGIENGWVAHSGVVPGFNSQVAYLPDLDIGIVVLTNADIAGAGGSPAPAIFGALAAVVAPDQAP